MAHEGGRPLEYTPDIPNKVLEYLDMCQDEEDEFHQTRGEKSDGYQRLVRVKLPTIEGLAVYLNIHKKTVYDWEDKFPEFSHVIDILRQKQANSLINNGLSGNYNATIAKVLLTKHGYREAVDTDLTTKGDKLESSEEIKKLAEQLNELKKKTN